MRIPEGVKDAAENVAVGLRAVGAAVATWWAGLPAEARALLSGAGLGLLLGVAVTGALCRGL